MHWNIIQCFYVFGHKNHRKLHIVLVVILHAHLFHLIQVICIII